MTSHKVYEVSWSEDGKKKKSYFAEIAGLTFFEYGRKAALAVTHDELHRHATEYPKFVMNPRDKFADYFDSVKEIRTIEEA